MHGEELKIPLLSIVVPCYNEEDVIGETVRRLTLLCSDLIDLEAELIFVDDGSQDRTLALLKDCQSGDRRVRVIGLARNFGHQIALTAGVNAASGDAVVLIDADLQDPPEVIHDMVAKWREGYDVVYGTRARRIDEPKLKAAAAHVFYRTLQRLSDISVPLDTGDFRLMSRRAVDALRSMPERDRFMRGMASWVGFRQITLPFTRAGRYAGKSKYSFRKLFRLASDGVLSFSMKPLQACLWLGLFLVVIAAAAGGYLFAEYEFAHVPVHGWAILLVAVIFMGGIQLLSAGTIGAYVGRIYNEVRGRPLYVVDEYLGFEATAGDIPEIPVAATVERRAGRGLALL